MKSILAILVCAGLSISAIAPNTTDAFSEKENFFSIKSGRIYFELTGVQSGQEILEWVDWGAKQYKYSKTKVEMMGFVQETETISITLGKDIYILNPQTKTGTHVVHEVFGELDEDERIALGEKMIADMGGKKVGKETLLGLECDIWQVDDMFSKIWEHKGLTLKSEVDMMGQKAKSEATKIEKDISIPDSKFSIEGYTITEVGNIGNGIPGFGQ